MDRVHSKSVHFRHSHILSNAHLGQGGRIWMYIICAIINYKIIISSGAREIIKQIATSVIESISIYSLGAIVGFNCLRWILIYLSAEHPSLNTYKLVIFLAVCSESIPYFWNIDGFVGIGIRYLSLNQMMKGVSYLLVTREIITMGMDDQRIEGHKEAPSLLRFILYPTLCYQKKYPAKEHISFKHLLLYSLMILPLSVFSFWALCINGKQTAKLFIAQPTAENYLDVFIWINAGWMSCFVLAFIVLYGIQSELTRFGDEHFFGSWWDSTLQEYWRKWNTLVYSWIKRHVHKALLKKSIPLKISRIIIFVISGLVHEYILSNALGHRGIGFLVMASQIPLDVLVKLAEKYHFISPQLSSMIIFNIVGAPLLAIICSL
ncbi:diacylglycerol O-acyltransferase 1 [Nematocida sp. AWRm80]|nr:diacylglycerol O-acyltransferase 1 [Nematocida sp. AWRm80]